MADLNLWIESAHLSSEGKEFHIMGAAKENKRCPNVFVRRLGIHRNPLSEEECKFICVNRLRVDQTSKWETSLKERVTDN